MTNSQQPDSKPGEPSTPRIEHGSRTDPKPEFNPYKFSKVTVPADLRRQMVEAHLPRLEAEFFHDTLPPNERALVEPSPESPRLDLAGLPPRRRPIKLVLALLMGALSLLLFGLLKSGLHPAQFGQSPSVAGAVSVSLSPARSAPMAATGTVSPAQAEAVVHSLAAPAASIKTLSSNSSSIHAIAAAQSSPRSVVRTSTRSKPALAEAPRASEAVATSAHIPAAPPPVQTSWFTPK